MGENNTLTALKGCGVKIVENLCLGLGCGTPTSFMHTAATAWMLQGMTITLAFMGWG